MTRYNIIDGPSKMDLMLAVFDSNISHIRPVIFSIEVPANRNRTDPLSPKINFVVVGVDREDCPGESWAFRGYIPIHREKDCGVITGVQGFFSTKTRKGWIEF